jgi:lipid-binding SYLF domain-containing protein
MNRRIACALLVLSALTLSVSSAAAEGFQDDVDQAVAILQRFREIPERSIPDAVLSNAKGLAILTVVKAGFIFSGRGGKGLVVARVGKGWSGPSAIGTGGAGFGLQIGARNEANAAYYGRSVTPVQILSGQVKPPRGAQKLLRILDKY